MSAAASAVAVTSIGSGVDPAIDGQMITWARTDGKEIHLYDKAIGKDLKIKATLACYPDIDISTNTLVWCENGKAPRLAIYDIKARKANYIPLPEAWIKPAISNGKIVWSAKGNINLYDVATKSQTVVATGYNPDISGDNIAYEAVDSAGGHYVSIYNIVSKGIFTVSQEGDLTNPRISGDYVIYTTGAGNLAEYIISTGEGRIINENNIPGHSDERELYSYALRGPIVVYSKSHDGPMGVAGVYVYDDGLRELRLLNATGDNTGATLDISGDSSGSYDVVWGFVGKADGAKKVNGGIYLASYSQTDIGIGNVYIDAGGDSAKIAIYQNGKLIAAKSGRIFEADLPVGAYMLILSNMGDPATVTQTFDLTNEGIYMEFSGSQNP